MGCDIHIYIEFKSTELSNWQSFGGRINPGRNYLLFTLLAGIRNYTAKLSACFPVRGLPTELGYHSNNDNKLYISNEKYEDCIAPEKAKLWVESRSSKYIHNHKDIPTWVTNPDWHSHSWLNTQEFEAVLGMYKNTGRPPEPQYEAILAAMRKLEELESGSRIVFWFDN